MENFLQGLPPKKKKVTDEKRLKMIPWVEKYRPKTVDEISHQDSIVSVMKQCLINKELPNFLFYGPPGTGKTSIILAMARQLFGSSFSDRVLELNASDERGIDVIRTKVKNFASLAIPEVSSVPPYKLIILDEADSMTPPAQAALRRTMETEMKTTRFCLTCNYVTKIINPITSRCSMFRFKKLDDEIPIKRLREISKKENLTVSDEDLIYIMNISEGDLRKGITLLQSASYLSSEIKLLDDVKHITISRDLIVDISSVIPSKYENDYFEALKSSDIDKVCSISQNLIKEGFSIQRFITQIYENFKSSDSKFKTLKDSTRSQILAELAKSEYRIVDGADEYLQFLSFSASAIDQLAY